MLGYVKNGDYFSQIVLGCGKSEDNYCFEPRFILPQAVFSKYEPRFLLNHEDFLEKSCSWVFLILAFAL